MVQGVLFPPFSLPLSHACADWTKPRVYKAHPYHSKRFGPGLKPWQCKSDLKKQKLFFLAAVWGAGCPFSTFFALPNSFLCRLDQIKSVQRPPTPQQTFWLRFETLAMQIGLKKTEIIFLAAVQGRREFFFWLSFSLTPRSIGEITWNHNLPVVPVGEKSSK